MKPKEPKQRAAEPVSRCSKSISLWVRLSYLIRDTVIRFIFLNCSQKRVNTRVVSKKKKKPHRLKAERHNLGSLRFSKRPPSSVPVTQRMLKRTCHASVRPHWERMIYSWTGNTNITASISPDRKWQSTIYFLKKVLTSKLLPKNQRSSEETYIWKIGHINR